MKKIKLVKMLVQGAVTIVFAGGIYAYTQSQVQPQEVYTFSRDIPVNTVIEEGDLIKKYIPRSAVSADMIINKDDIIGKAVSTKSFPGQYPVKQQLASPNELNPLEDIDLSNYRKISIEMSPKNAIGGNVKKGDKVDLLSVREGDVAGEGAIEAKIFLQDIIVYNVIDDGGRKYVDKTEGSSVLLNEKGEVIESGALSIVTFAVTAQQAEELEAKKKVGELKLIGRFEESIDTNTVGKVIGTSKF